MDERNSQYELQPSRNGLTVPVINGVYLHSIFNPMKEAEAFGKIQAENLKYKNKALILGLGFGYHVEEIARIMSAKNNDFEIVILEPNERLVEDFIGTRDFEDKNIKIVCKQKVKELFNDWNFVQFLMDKPCIIKHDASYVLEKEFYSSFLAYQAPKDIVNYKENLSQNSKDIFSTRDERSLQSFTESILNSRKILNHNEFLLLALNEVANMEYKGK